MPSTTSRATVIGMTSENAASPTARHQHAQDLLGGVGARREVVRGEHRQRRGLAQRLVFEPLRVQRRAQQSVLDPIRQRLGDLSDSRWQRWKRWVDGDRGSVLEEHDSSELSPRDQFYRGGVKIDRLAVKKS